MTTIRPAPAPDTSGQPIRRRFGTPRFRADGDLHALAYAGDGSLLSVEDPGVLRHWSGNGKARERAFLCDTVTLWSFSPSAIWLAGGGDELLVWEVEEQLLMARWDLPCWVTAVEFHPSGAMVATGHDDGSVRLWQPGISKPLAEIRGHGSAIASLAFHPRGELLATAGEDRVVRTWDLKRDKPGVKCVGHADRISFVAWQFGKFGLVSAGWDGSAYCWDAETGQCRGSVRGQYGDALVLAALSLDGNRLVAVEPGGVVNVWAAPDDARPRLRLRVPSDEIPAVTIRPDGTYLAVAGADRAIAVWDLDTGEAMADRTGAASSVDLCPRPNGYWLVQSGPAVGFRVWDLQGGDAPDLPMPPEPPVAVACSPDGSRIAAVAKSGEPMMWTVKNGHFIYPGEGAASALSALAFNADSTLLATACRAEGTAWLWDTTTCDPRLLIPEAADGCSVEAVAFHPDGRTLACGGIDWMQTGGTDGAVVLWDVPDRQRKQTIPHGATDLQFDAAGERLLLAGSGECVVVWDIARHAAATTFRGGRGTRVNAARFGPGEQFVVAGFDDGTLRAWALSTGETILLRELDSAPRGLRFDAAGGLLFVALDNGTALEFDWPRLLDDG